MPKEDQGLDQEAIDQETAVELPEREAMSLVDPNVAKTALSSFAVSGDPVDPPIDPSTTPMKPTTQ